jgi:hypothetical protein
VKRTGASIAGCVASVALIVYVVVRVVFDSVPMGYGPWLEASGRVTNRCST